MPAASHWFGLRDHSVTKCRPISRSSSIELMPKALTKNLTSSILLDCRSALLRLHSLSRPLAPFRRLAFVPIAPVRSGGENETRSLRGNTDPRLSKSKRNQQITDFDPRKMLTVSSRVFQSPLLQKDAHMEEQFPDRSKRDYPVLLLKISVMKTHCLFCDCPKTSATRA